MKAKREENERIGAMKKSELILALTLRHQKKIGGKDQEKNIGIISHVLS